MKILTLSLLLLLASVSVCAQDATAPPPSPATATATGNFYARWSARVSAAQSKQPSWAVPLVTTYTGLFQVVRTDIIRQVAPAGTDTWNYDNSKGVNFIIPQAKTEIGVDLPPYIQHNTAAVDGWGDFSFLVKYRIAAANAKHGNYTLSAWALTTVPSGQAKNGSTNASVQPNLGAGKGFGKFDVQTSIGATLPTGTPATTATGKPVLWNTAAQYKIGKLFWPELESNATFYKGGANDGKTQELLTPGIVIGRCGLHPDNPKSRPGLVFGGGMQIATSHFHTYNHGLVLTARWVF
ncbi:MAG TPA: hypothetical protein VGG56_14670 [Terracidiphilus sp.]|jgi:hypothetical protein